MTLEVKIVADTRAFRAALLRCRLRTESSGWRQAWLRFRLWRVEREPDPRKET